ncbi:S-adenosylmethionine hydrolase [Actinokineospora baliensis]|uniref:SAM hydrolase/SAM-dependent halogenase family protein n=1 Tax=Actinokineospora baliensis TaxID=547056 RepID=UPI0027DC2ACE|nr:SAM-dependent chlorinase/fluorinase [Actinokineospora baliensis]MBM7770751.1 S-adenosylmethionine hydrolase [Actinokineospora baliensis]
MSDTAGVGYDWVSFTTDYGRADGFAAVCEGVVARTAPHARVLHISHEIPRQDVRSGAALLAGSVPYLPRAVHLAVVDPGVGTSRRPIAIVSPEGVLIGPDNGLLPPAAEVLGGAIAAYEITEFHLEPVSATFHGRDVFAPAAAQVATGVTPNELGPAVDLETLVRLPEPVTHTEPGRVTTEVLGSDTFGNVRLAAKDLVADPGTVVHAQVGDRSLEAVVGRTFADARWGDAVVLLDSAGQVAIAVNGGSAAEILLPRPGDRAVLLLAAAPAPPASA